MASYSDLTVEARDVNLNRIGQILWKDIQKLIVEDQFNNVGSWTLAIASDHPLAETLRQPGSGIIVTMSDGAVLMSGPTIKPETARTIDDPAGTLTIDGLTDTVFLADALAYPQPSNANVSTQSVAEDVRTGAAETLMHAYVNANIGPSAPAARQHPHLQMGTDGGRGSVVTKRPKFQALGALMNELAMPENLGFRVVQVGTHLEFQTYAVQDRSVDVRLDIENNMLAGDRVAIAPPGATRAIVAGDGDGTDRVYVEVTTTDSLSAESSWGRRIEKFVDKKGTADTLELAQAGLEDLVDEGFSQVAVQIVPQEDFALELGRDWFMGDKVTVVVEDVELSSIVTGFVIKADKDGQKIGAVLGDPFGFDNSNAQKVSKMEARVSALERAVEITQNVGPRLVALEADMVTVQAGLPGMTVDWPGATAPAGWHLLDGASLSVSANPVCFSIFGYTYGGSGSSFSLPNAKGREIVMLDSSQTEFNTLGKTGGEKAHVLTQTEMPVHTHVQDPHNHTQNAHHHGPGAGGAQFIGVGGSGELYNVASASFYGFTNQGSSTADTTATNNPATATNQNAGGGAAHNNLSPYLVLNKIIKLG